ncbi:hypothetical protein GCM10019059_41600 [Camelimonas fluminis]|nr:hypothetical protein GCM10019059_41600 [Camelimonas fluminis]
MLVSVAHSTCEGRKWGVNFTPLQAQIGGSLPHRLDTAGGVILAGRVNRAKVTTDRNLGNRTSLGVRSNIVACATREIRLSVL